MILIFEILKQSLMISSLVFVMMLILDYFNVLTNGNINNIIKRRKKRQYLISSFLGSTPGCLGAFLNVSFYVHGLISFGALTGGMIATSGDEAFVMLALFPKQALLLFALLFIFGIILGRFFDKIATALKFKTCEEFKLYKVHFTKGCKCFDKQTIIQNYLKLSRIRIFLLVGAIVVLVAIITGLFGPSSWEWKRITFAVLFVISLGIIATVPEHFLREHI